MLTATSQYALQAVVFLAEQSGESCVAGKHIAVDVEIPRKYLSTVLATLVRKGVLNSSPGTNGGFRLAKRPREIRLYDVLEPFEPVLWERRPCPFGKKHCGDENPCDGHKHWKKVRDAYLKFVHDTSVHDVMSHVVEPSNRKAKKRKRR